MCDAPNPKSIINLRRCLGVLRLLALYELGFVRPYYGQ